MAPIRLKVFKTGNSLALRLPKSLGMHEGEELLGFREGEALVLKPADRLGWPTGYFDSWEPIEFELPEREGVEARDKRFHHLFGGKGGL